MCATGPVALQASLIALGCCGHSRASTPHFPMPTFVGHWVTLGNGPRLAGQATPAHTAQTCSEDERSTRTWQNEFAWLAGGHRQHGVGGWVGRQGSPLGARWNSTSFSGHTTAKGKEKGKEEVRREAQRHLQVSAPAWALH